MTVDQLIQRKFRFGRRSNNLPWYPRKGDRLTLATMFNRLGYKTGVEVGTSFGKYAYALCELNPGLHLYCVDPWGIGIETEEFKQRRQDRIYNRAKVALSQFNVELVRKKSLDAVDSFGDGSVDFVYIDGDHRFDFVIQDLVRWAPKVRLGGVVALHDYSHAANADVIKAVDAYTHCHHIDPWYLTNEKIPTAFWVQR